MTTTSRAASAHHARNGALGKNQAKENMTAKEALLAFCETRLPKASEDQFAYLNAGAVHHPSLTDFNVGTIFTLYNVHYLVPTSGQTREEFIALRAKWQQAESTE